MRFFRALAGASSFLSVLAQQDLSGLLRSQSNLTNLTSLLNSYPSAYKNLSSLQGVTIFAPSDLAFSKIDSSVLGPAFSSNYTDFITQLLFYHVASGIHPASSLTGSFQFLPTLLNNQTYTNVTGGQVIAVVEQAGNISVAVTGLGSRSTLTTTDLSFNNGILHIIDTVFIPPVPFTESCPAFNLTASEGAFLSAPSILSNYTDNAPDLTIFAPSNLALQAISSSLSSYSVQDLTSLLEYHIIASNTTPYYSANLPNGLPRVGGNGSADIYNETTIRSVQGGNLTITFAYNSLFVNQARIIQQDLLLSNGVLHVIDSVLDPNATHPIPAPQPTATTPVQILPGTVLGNTLPFTTAIPSTTSVLFSLVTATPSQSVVTATGGSAASTTGSGALHSSKGAGERVEVGRGGTGVVLGILVWVLGFL